jgi:hypothetical protein
MLVFPPAGGCCCTVIALVRASGMTHSYATHLSVLSIRLEGSFGRLSDTRYSDKPKLWRHLRNVTHSQANQGEGTFRLKLRLYVPQSIPLPD